MLNNYLKITFRQIVKNKTVGLINFAGLSIGTGRSHLVERLGEQKLHCFLP